MKILVIGLENSVTKALAQTIAINLGILNAEQYDGHGKIDDNLHTVQHYSFPYGENRPKNSRDYYPDINPDDWDRIIISTRDYYSSLKSKIVAHQPNKELAKKEHEAGRIKLRELAAEDNAYFFSYESWFILGTSYFVNFFNSIGIYARSIPKCKDINSKWHTDII